MVCHVGVLFNRSKEERSHKRSVAFSDGGKKVSSTQRTKKWACAKHLLVTSHFAFEEGGIYHVRVKAISSIDKPFSFPFSSLSFLSSLLLRAGTSFFFLPFMFGVPPSNCRVLLETGALVCAKHDSLKAFLRALLASQGPGSVHCLSREKTFTLSRIRTKKTRFRGHQANGIGIIARCDSQAFRFANAKECQLSYYYGGNGTIKYCKGGEHFQILENTHESWGTGDIIKITIDCSKWTLLFLKNGKNVTKLPIKIKEIDAYYFALQFCPCKGHKYRILENE